MFKKEKTPKKLIENDDEKLSPTEWAHLWQDFRIRCVNMAIAANATASDGNIVTTAEAIAKYILTKDPLELKGEDEF